MKKITHRASLITVFSLLLLLLFSCYDRYPYFLQQPEFGVSYPEDGSAGIYLSMSTPDRDCVIRYTIDDREPSESYGTLYEEPVYLTGLSHVSAVAYRVGYPAGPTNYYEYDPENP